MPGTGLETFQHVAVTTQEGYKLPGENPSPNASVAVSAMHRQEGGQLFRARSATRSAGGISPSELGQLGPKASSHLVCDENLRQDQELRRKVRRAQFGMNEIPGELYVPPEVKKLCSPPNLADAIAGATVASVVSRSQQIVQNALPDWKSGTKWHVDFEECRTAADLKAVLNAYVSSDQTPVRRQEFEGRSFG